MQQMTQQVQTLSDQVSAMQTVETGLETARKEIACSFASMNHLEQRVSDLSQQLKSIMKVTEELSFRWLHAESPQS